MKESVSNWFYDMSDVNFIKYKNHMSYHDIAIATYWTTAYEIKKFENQFRYIFYMTQDNEAMFNPMSSNYILAENSYRLGFNHICSGPWMHNFITKKFQVTSDYFKIKKEEFFTKKRTQNIAYPRQIAMYLCREMADFSYPRIGEFFGGRDHTTVIHAYEKIVKKIKEDPNCEKTITYLVDKLKQ